MSALGHADIPSCPHHVRYSPESGHSSARVARPLCANSGLNGVMKLSARLSLPHFLDLALLPAFIEERLLWTAEDIPTRYTLKVIRRLKPCHWG